MNKKTIGMVAAMPDEIRPFLKRVPAVVRGRLGRYDRYDFSLGDKTVTLVQSGMGPFAAKAATKALIDAVSPEVIVNFGFTGGVRTDTQAGDLVLAREVLLLEGGRFTAQPGPDGVLNALILRACAAGSLPVKEGVFITSARLEDKREVAALLAGDVAHPVLEMETAAVMAAAHEARVPVVALRGVSDGAGEELGFSLEEFCDDELVLRPVRVLLTVARKPWIIPQLIRLAGNAKRAGEKLARSLEMVLNAL